MQPSTPEQFMAEIELFSINEKHGASSAVSRKRNWQRFCSSLQQCTVKSLWWVYDCESTYSCPQLGCINEHHQVWWFYDYWIHAGFQLWSWTFPISSSRLSTSHWWPVMLATDSLKFKERTLKRMTHMTQPLLHHQEWIERTRLRSQRDGAMCLGHTVNAPTLVFASELIEIRSKANVLNSSFAHL